MKHFLLITFLAIICCKAFAQGFTVDSCHFDYTLSKEGYFDVMEHYYTNFTEQKHGIFRNIITKYRLTGESGKVSVWKIKIDQINVPGRPFSHSSSFVAKSEDKMEIKIGDKDRLVYGPQEYIVKYRVHNGFLYRENEVDFYWNLKSSDWPAQFKHISFAIHLPDNPELNTLQYFLYSGPNGTTVPDTSFHMQYLDGTLSGSDTIDYSGIKPYSFYGSSLTLLIKLPKGAVQREYGVIAGFWNEWGWILLWPVLLLSFFIIWWHYGKDKKLIVPVAYYPPKDMDPAMAGYLLNDAADGSDLISLIPHWGAQGLITIQEISKEGIFGTADTILRMLKPLPSDTSAYETTIFNGLFGKMLQPDLQKFEVELLKAGIPSALIGQMVNNVTAAASPAQSEVRISSLRNTFYTTMNAAKKELKQAAKPYYDQQSEKIKTLTTIALIIIAIAGTFTFLYTWGPLAAISTTVFCVALIFINYRIMSKKNIQGNRVFTELMGFRMFIATAEQHKLEMLLQEDPGYFEKTMGYAFAFGMLKKWGKKFEGLNLQPPSWYSNNSHSLTSFSAAHFANSFAGAMSHANSAMVSSPSGSSSGGGSSGGGGGGGGGGSW